MGPEVDAPADRKYSCWLGGAILSKIKAFNDSPTPTVAIATSATLRLNKPLIASNTVDVRAFSLPITKPIL